MNHSLLGVSARTLSTGIETLRIDPSQETLQSARTLSTGIETLPGDVPNYLNEEKARTLSTGIETSFKEESVMSEQWARTLSTGIETLLWVRSLFLYSREPYPRGLKQTSPYVESHMKQGANLIHGD